MGICARSKSHKRALDPLALHAGVRPAPRQAMAWVTQAARQLGAMGVTVKTSHRIVKALACTHEHTRAFSRMAFLCTIDSSTGFHLE